MKIADSGNCRSPPILLIKRWHHRGKRSEMSTGFIQEANDQFRTDFEMFLSADKFECQSGYTKVCGGRRANGPVG